MRKCKKCGSETDKMFCPECDALTESMDTPEIIEFETGWKRICEDLEEEKEFRTTGGKKTFIAWHPSGANKITYKKSTGDICDLPKSEFKKAYEIFKRTGELSKTTPYHELMHGSYYPPLLKKYFRE